MNKSSSTNSLSNLPNLVSSGLDYLKSWFSTNYQKKLSLSSSGQVEVIDSHQLLIQKELQGKLSYLQNVSRKSSGDLIAQDQENNLASLEGWENWLIESELEENMSITQFVQRVNIALNQRNIDFQVWKTEQERILTLQLRAIDASLSREARAYERETGVELLNQTHELKNSPIWLTARQLLSDNELDSFVIFLSPVSSQQGNLPANFPSIETQVQSKLSQLANFYSTRDRKVKFIGGAWTNTAYQNEAAAQALFSCLKSIPTAIIDADVEGSYFYLRYAFWGINWATYRSSVVISQLSWTELQYDFAKLAALQWKAEREAEIASGGDPELIDNLYGEEQVQQFLADLKMMAQEELALSKGLDLNRIKRSYKITDYEIERSGEYLAVLHCIWAGLLADEYFLLHSNQINPKSPLLPELLPILLENLGETNLTEIIEKIITYYDILYQVLETLGQSSLIPDLRLQLASSLARITNQVGAKQQLDASIKCWLQLRGVDNIPPELYLEAIESRLTPADSDYIEQLNVILNQLGATRPIYQAEMCYHRGLKYYQDKNYPAAILEFEQAISHKPEHFEARFYRGQAYLKLPDYLGAIADFTYLIDQNYQAANCYECRANAYDLIENYDQAIADYEQAISLTNNKTPIIDKLGKIKSKQQKIIRKLKSQQIPPLQEFNFTVVELNAQGREISRSNQVNRFYQEDIGDNIILEMVEIPAGTFEMGSNLNGAEEPIHTVTIQQFFLGKYLITQQQWLKVMGHNPARFQGMNLPVEQISWDEAQEFCLRLSDITHRIYRLPTEAEWEYAARGKTTTIFHFGASINPKFANYNGYYSYELSPKGEYRQTTTEVGSLGVANNFGLYDIHGNVWEWCADCWHENYSGAPTNGQVWDYPLSDYRVLRGGAWNYNPRACRSSERYYLSPSTKHSYIGLRVAMSVPQ